jgi:peptidoglycan/LPS O-acetylase OafA/YrhL
MPESVIPPAPPRRADQLLPPATPIDHTRGRFLGIQILRGVSVAFTVLAHLPTTTAPFAAFGRPAPWFIGVAIFYAISGWIIAHVTRDHTGADIAAFLTRRLFRIVPILLVSVSLTLGFAIALPHSPIVDQFYPEPWTALRAGVANLLFISDIGIMLAVPAPYSLEGLWSISVEVKFYLVYALLLVVAPLLRRWALLAILLLIGLTRWRLLFAGYPVAASHVFFLELFCIGGISYRYYRYFIHSWPLAIVAWTWVLAFPMLRLPGNWFLVGYAMLLMSIVYIVNHAATAVIRETPGCMAKALIWLGERSYVLYVLHFQILAIAGLFAQLLGINFSSPRVFDWTLNVSIVLGLPLIEFFHQTVEKGGIRLGARIAGGVRR